MTGDSIDSDGITNCNLFRITTGAGGCSNRMPSGTVANIDPDCDPSVDFSLYKYYGEIDSNGDTLCRLWKNPATNMSSLILPGLVFAALCVLLIIMIVKSIREKAAMRAKYEANYKELQTSATVELSNAKTTRVPHSQFSCGGLTMTFQVSSNMNTPKKPEQTNNLPAVKEDPKV